MDMLNNDGAGLMGIKSNIVSMIVAFTIMQGLFLAITIALKKSSARRANIILSIFIIIYSYTLTNIVMGFSDLHYYITPLLFTDLPFLTLIGPFFYFYVMEVTDTSYKKKWYYLLHFIFFVIAIALMLPFYLMRSESKIIYLFNIGKRIFIPYNIDIIVLGHQIQMFIYLFFSTRLITNYRNRIKQIYSSIDKINLSWLVFFKNALFICYLLQFLIGLTMLFGIQILMPYNFFVIILISCIIIFSLGYKILLNPEIYSGLLKRKDGIHLKDFKSRIVEEKSDIMMDNLRKIMLNNKIYLDPELSLDTLANKVSINKYHLSELINIKMGLNFYDFVNSYRIEEVKKYLNQRSDEKIISIAMDSGFNTKATFNTAFKKHTGMTPSQYKKSLLAS